MRSTLMNMHTQMHKVYSCSKSPINYSLHVPMSANIKNPTY